MSRAFEFKAKQVLASLVGVGLLLGSLSMIHPAALIGKGKEPSLTDIVGGIGDFTRATSAEQEVVKTAGGNWKEHLWVKNAIETARVQQDINDAVAHNYALFQEYQEEIEAFV